MKNPFINLLYIFQSEHYDRIRFLKFVYIHLNWFSLSNRGKIDWTLRAKILITLASMFLSLLVLAASFHPSFLYPIVVFIWGYLLFPLFLIIADICIAPLITWKKNKITQEARKLVDTVDMKIIGITGSYGKTTLKNILESILKEKYAVMVLPGNINTDLGVANYLLSHNSEVEKSDILIVEMGAYKIGEILNICNITPPDYSFLTAIAPVHLERFGSVENIIQAKFEIVDAVKQKAFVNTDNKRIKNERDRRKNDTKEIQKIVPIKMNGNDIPYTYLPDFKGIRFEYNGVQYETKHIAHHSLGMIGMALDLAKELEIDDTKKQKGVQNIPYISHRLEVTKNYQTGVTVIDDSYNGNEDGFLSAIETLCRAKGRKIVLTPGIVELGIMQKEVHKRLAHVYIQKKIDTVLLIKNSNTLYIEEVFKDEKFTNYTIYQTAKDAHTDLPNILRKGDVILFQNDLTDNYM